MRYSLRSLCNLPIRNVWIIGGWPDWYRGHKLRVSQNGFKHEVTDRAMTAACEHPDISDPFLMMNDDFFVMESGDLPQPMHDGTIAAVLDRYRAAGESPSTSGYLRRLLATMQALQARGIYEPLSYELHTPFMVEKLAMLGATRRPGHQRSMYGNLARIGGGKVDDVKVYDPDPTGLYATGRWLSTSDTTFPLVEPMLRERFPKRSRWELHG